jgi:hypothetical protein
MWFKMDRNLVDPLESQLNPTFSCLVKTDHVMIQKRNYDEKVISKIQQHLIKKRGEIKEQKHLVKTI